MQLQTSACYSEDYWKIDVFVAASVLGQLLTCTAAKQINLIAAFAKYNSCIVYAIAIDVQLA